MDDLCNTLGEPIQDAEEESFLVFSHSFPSHSLGFIEDKATSIDITVAGRHLTIHHSRALLNSQRKEGTTGAVVWKVTPLFADWISSPNFLFQNAHLASESVVLELGSGVAGIVALALAPKVKQYIATDQDYVLRLLKQNISDNMAATVSGNSKKTNQRHKKFRASEKTLPPDIQALKLDWEADSVTALSAMLQPFQTSDRQVGVDCLIACDCIYNDALIEPFNRTCTQICRLRVNDASLKPTICLIAQQLRSHEVFETWLKNFQETFHVWQVPDKLLAESLREGTGYIVHAAILR